MVIAGWGSACSLRSQCRSTYRPRTWRRIDPTAKSEPVCRRVRTILVQPPAVTVSSESTKVTRSPVDSRDAAVAGGAEAGVVLADHPDPGVARGVVPGDVGAAVGGAVVDQQHLEVRVALPEHRVEALREVALDLVDRHDHAQQRLVGQRAVRPVVGAVDGAVGGAAGDQPPQGSSQPSSPTTDRDAHDEPTYRGAPCS